MRIRSITSQNRRDFQAIYECEHCGDAHEGSGYDDSYFHQTVIPDMQCKKCGKTAASDYQPNTTKYPDHLQL